jgi:hypothetical protein
MKVRRKGTDDTIRIDGRHARDGAALDPFTEEIYICISTF